MWMRDNYQKVSGANAAVMFFAFFDDQPLVELDPARDGPASQIPGLVIRALGTPRSSLEELLGFDLLDNAYEVLLSAPERDRVLRADSVVMIGGQVEDPPGLQLLWNAMAVTRAAAFGGAFLTLDFMARKWWKAEQLKALDPGRDFMIEEHIQIDTIDDESAPFVRTSGMEKFARPELVIPGLSGQAEQRNAATALLNEIAHRMAEGKAYNENSLLRLDCPSGLVEAEFLPTTQAEDDFFGTTRALVVVDPNRDASPLEKKRQGCPRAVGLMAMARQPNAPKNQADPTESSEGSGTAFTSVMAGSLKLVRALVKEQGRIFTTITGHPWGSSAPQTDRIARERLQSLVGAPLAGKQSDRDLLFAVAAALVAEEKLGLETDLEACSEAERRLYDSHADFVSKTEFGPLFGVEKLEEELPAEVTAGLWLYYGYMGRLPGSLEVEDCASFGVLFGLKVGELELSLSGRKASLSQLARVAEPFWNSLYEKLGRDLSRFIPMAKIGMVDMLAGRNVSEPSAETSQKAFVSLCSLLEKQTGRVYEAPPLGAVVPVKFMGRELELSLFRTLFCALVAHIVCDENDLSFSPQECEPNLLLAYAGIAALSESLPVAPGPPYQARSERAARTFFAMFEAQISPQALPVVEALGQLLAQIAARVARMTGH